MVDAGSIDLRLNHLGSLSLNTAQVQGTPSLPVEVDGVADSFGGLVGIGTIGDSIGCKTPNSRLGPSLDNKQNNPESEGRGMASIALDNSSERIASHPD